MFDTRTRSKSCDARVQEPRSSTQESTLFTQVEVPNSTASTPEKPKSKVPAVWRGRRPFDMLSPGNNENPGVRPHSTGRLMSPRDGSPKPSRANMISKTEESPRSLTSRVGIHTMNEEKIDTIRIVPASGVLTSEHLASESCSISALEAFNKLVRGCDALKRLKEDPYACFATKKNKKERCTRPRCDIRTRNDPERNIHDLLDKMSRLHFTRKELLEAQNLLRIFSDSATCAKDHRKEYFAAIAVVEGNTLFPAKAEVENETKEEASKRESRDSEQSCVETRGKSAVSSGFQGHEDQGDEQQPIRQDSSTAHSSTPAINLFNKIFPVARRWFRSNGSKCLWQKDNNTRCGRRVLTQNQGLIRDQKMFERLEELMIDTNGPESSDLLGKIADLTFCKAYHRGVARAKIEESVAWPLLYNDAASIVDKTLPEEDKTYKQKVANKLLAASVLKPDIALNETKTFLFGIKRKGTQVGYLPKFVPDNPSGRFKMKLCDWVQMHISRKLTNILDKQDGYIYAYWNRATFGSLKIGYTTKDVTRRLREWEVKCSHIVDERYRSATRIPHAHRLEQIIHAELREYSVRKPCCSGCGRKHEEWFKDIDDAVYIPTIEKWTKWMMERPYEEDLQRGGWYLSKLAEEALPELCKQIVDQAASKISHIPKFQPKRTPARRAKKVASQKIRRILTRNLNVQSQHHQPPDPTHGYNLRSGETLEDQGEPPIVAIVPFSDEQPGPTMTPDVHEPVIDLHSTG